MTNVSLNLNNYKWFSGNLPRAFLTLRKKCDASPDNRSSYVVNIVVDRYKKEYLTFLLNSYMMSKLDIVNLLLLRKRFKHMA